ncbi:general substrate transporter [Ilyonectria robusta]|uniref:general substrate transporter n=1 Tax=Ilyonectria robusta TaxID=1079257 RepID=UPI001E8D4805|nr:general substrate transporter [Ilyonectria robusta]KAH8686244.1 general substrate transporter [Ilyonectria robusta]
METYSWYNVTVVCFAAFGSLFTGYSLAVFAFTLGQPTFYSSLGLEQDPTVPGYSHTNDIIGASNGVFFGTGFFGCFLAGWAGNRFGRVNGFRIAAITGIIGGVLQCASQSPAMFLVSRAVAGLAAGHTMAAMPTYFTEVAPPHSRGLITGAHGIFINVGYCIAGWIGFGCYFTPDSEFAWRFPFAVVIIWALCLLAGSFYVPESPRFLVQHDDHQKALDILVRLHHDPNDPNNTFAHQELEMIVQRWQAEKEVVRVDGRWRLFTKKANRQRLVLAWLVMAGGQNIGPLVINNYNVLLYGSLGLGPTTSLLLSAVYNTVGFIISCIGGLMADRLGRRKSMITGYVLITCVFATLTGMIAKYNNNPTKSWAVGATVMIYLFVVCYNSFIDLNQFTVATEIFPTHIRNQASAVAISGLFLADILWLNLLPTATATIGWKYYLIFVCLAVVHTIHLFFNLPETGGWHLEEMDCAMGGGDGLSQDGKIDIGAERGDSNHVEATTNSIPMERKQDM